MIKDEELEELKQHLDENGKLIISPDLSEKKIERYQFINSLNIDLISLLSRKKENVDFPEEVNDLSSYDDSDDIETLDFNGTVESKIEEDDSADVSDLDNFF